MADIASYHLDLPCSRSQMTNLILFSTWKTLRNISFVSGLMILYSNYCWKLSAAAFWACKTKTLYLAPRRPSMVVIWSYYLTLGWSRLTSLLYFFDWKNLRKFLIISLLTNCNYSFCWNRAGVPSRNCSKDMLWYTASRNLLIALICVYCSYSWCVSLRTCVMETMYLVFFLKGFRRLIFVLTGRVYLATGGAVPILYISQV